jgi:hypothetical protein
LIIILIQYIKVDNKRIDFTGKCGESQMGLIWMSKKKKKRTKDKRKIIMSDHADDLTAPSKLASCSFKSASQRSNTASGSSADS